MHRRAAGKPPRCSVTNPATSIAASFIASLESLGSRCASPRHHCALDLSFVRDWVADLYAPVGRPSIDPVVFFQAATHRVLRGATAPERQLMSPGYPQSGTPMGDRYAVPAGTISLPDHYSPDPYPAATLRPRPLPPILRACGRAFCDEAQRAHLGQELPGRCLESPANAADSSASCLVCGKSSTTTSLRLIARDLKLIQTRYPSSANSKRALLCFIHHLLPGSEGDCVDRETEEMMNGGISSAPVASTLIVRSHGGTNACPTGRSVALIQEHHLDHHAGQAHDPLGARRIT